MQQHKIKSIPVIDRISMSIVFISMVSIASVVPSSVIPPVLVPAALGRIFVISAATVLAITRARPAPVAIVAVVSRICGCMRERVSTAQHSARDATIVSAAGPAPPLSLVIARVAAVAIAELGAQTRVAHI
jgi:hypothetical protein